MSVVLVDWLGRGGIAQCSRAWMEVLSGAHRGGQERVVVVTRKDRELVTCGTAEVVGEEAASHPLISHRRVARRAARVIQDERPSMVVVQNYVVPALEQAVIRSARRVGARVVVVVHDHRLLRGTAGTGLGLRRLLAGADVIVCHSGFVARGVERTTGRRDLTILPLPAAHLAGEEPGEPAVRAGRGRPLAVHFGMLGKRYKGTHTVLRLAAAGVPPWQFAFLGPGAPASVPGALTAPGFLDHSTLVRSVRASAATLLPYSEATQSAAVSLAQACGSVVVAHPVGAIPEQVTDGVNGILVPVGADDSTWARVLADLVEPTRRRSLAEAGLVTIRQDWAAFSRGVDGLTV